MVELGDPLIWLGFGILALIAVIVLDLRYRPRTTPKYEHEPRNASALIPGLGHVTIQGVRSRQIGIIDGELIASLKMAGLDNAQLDRLMGYIGLPLFEFQLQTDKGTKIVYNTDCIITTPEQFENAYTHVDFRARSDIQETIQSIKLLNRNIMTYKAQLDMILTDHYSATSRMTSQVKQWKKDIGGSMVMPMKPTGSSSWSSGNVPVEGGGETG
jgi:hypothetical protein